MLRKKAAYKFVYHSHNELDDSFEQSEACPSPMMLCRAQVLEAGPNIKVEGRTSLECLIPSVERSCLNAVILLVLIQIHDSVIPGLTLCSLASLIRPSPPSHSCKIMLASAHCPRTR